MKTDKVNLASKLAQFQDHWQPRTVARLNDYDIMVVKVLVLDGQLEIRLRDRTVVLGPGELFVVPGDVEHQTYAEREASLLLIEPRGTPNTGDARTAAPRQEL